MIVQSCLSTQVNVLSTAWDHNITTPPRCKDGYGLASQTASLSCQSDGTWSKNSIKCQPNPCTLPSNLSAPYVVITGKELTPVGGTITLSCPPGLHLQGSAIAECLVSNWLIIYPTLVIIKLSTNFIVPTGWV